MNAHNGMQSFSKQHIKNLQCRHFHSLLGLSCPNVMFSSGLGQGCFP